MRGLPMMKYNGYVGKVVYDSEARLFHGDVLGLRAVITFQGKTVDEVDQAFKDSIDTYIDWCKNRGVEPEKPFSGNLHIRLSPRDHKRLVQEAAERKMSLNSFIVEKLTKKSGF